MRDYTEISKWLRNCADINGGCTTCPMIGKTCCVMTLQGNAADAIEELLAELTTIRKQMPHWISVEERLPEQGERVLVSNGGFICESYLSQSGKWQRGGVDMFFMTPTHWMPLPEAPKEENKR